MKVEKVLTNFRMSDKFQTSENISDLRQNKLRKSERTLRKRFQSVQESQTEMVKHPATCTSKLFINQRVQTTRLKLLKKSLANQKEIGNRTGEASRYVNLGAVYQSVDEYDKAMKSRNQWRSTNKRKQERKWRRENAENKNNGKYENA